MIGFIGQDVLTPTSFDIVTMKRNVVATAFATTVLALPTIGHAQHLCWVERVVQTQDGMALHFASHANLRVSVAHQESPGQRTSFLVGDGVARLQNPSGSAGDEAEVVLQIGDEAYASQLPEDSCVLRAVKQGDQVGIVAEAYMNMPGLPPTTSRQFVVAE